MEDEELLAMASKLESSFDFDAAQSQLSLGKPWMWLTGNRDSLLLLATSFIRAAAAAIPENECRAAPVYPEHQQICIAKTDQILHAIQRIDCLPENAQVVARKKREAWCNDAVELLTCGLLGFTLLMLSISGVAFWWHIITGRPLN